MGNTNVKCDCRQTACALRRNQRIADGRKPWSGLHGAIKTDRANFEGTAPRLRLGNESERDQYCGRQRHALRGVRPRTEPTATDRTNLRYRCGRSPNGGIENPLPSDQRSSALPGRVDARRTTGALAAFLLTQLHPLRARFTSQSHTMRNFACPASGAATVSVDSICAL